MLNTVIQIIPRRKSYLSLQKKKNCFSHYNININSDSINIKKKQLEHFLIRVYYYFLYNIFFQNFKLKLIKY